MGGKERRSAAIAGWIRGKAPFLIFTEENMDSTSSKISEALLNYIEPLLEVLGDEPEKAELEQTVFIGMAVWNACVMDTVDGSLGYVAQIRENTANDSESQSLMEFLINRKHSEFADDLRIISDPEVVWRNGEWRVRAAARAPLS